MRLPVTYSLLIVAVTVVCNLAERWLPFLLLRGREVPPLLHYVGGILPMAVMTTLVFYCVRDVSFACAGGWLPQAIAVGVTAALHLWRRSTLLSIAGGTACYMLLVQAVF